MSPKIMLWFFRAPDSTSPHARANLDYDGKAVVSTNMAQLGNDLVTLLDGERILLQSGKGGDYVISLSCPAEKVVDAMKLILDHAQPLI